MTLLTAGLATQSGIDFLSKVCHLLAQPLTELHGTLELALLRESDIDATRDSLKQSLAAAGRAIASLYFLQDLVDASEPGDLAPLEMSGAIRDIFEEFRPVAEAEQIKFEALSGPELWISGNLSRVTQALTRIMDSLLAASPRSIRLEPVVRGCELHVTGARLDALAASCPVELARILLNAMHCDLTVSDSVVTITVNSPANTGTSFNPASKSEGADCNDLVCHD